MLAQPQNAHAFDGQSQQHIRAIGADWTFDIDPCQFAIELEHAFNEDERARSRGEPPRRPAVVSGDVSVAAAYRSQDAIDFYLQPIPEGIWKNEVTLRSTRAARMYEPGIWVSRVSPTPLLMVVARDDKLTVADLALAAYERALEPKRLALIPRGHYGRFGGRECCFDRASELMGELVWQRRTDETQEQFKRRVMADAPQRKWSNATVIVFW